MALNATTLGAAIRSAILSKGEGITDNAATTALCDAIAEAVVAHITANAVVPALGLIAPPGTGGGPVTGSAVIT